MAWTLEYDGTERTFADWGFAQPVRTLTSQGLDQVTFLQPAVDLDADPVIPFEGAVVIYRDASLDAAGALVPGTGTKWFQGVALEPARDGSDAAEGLRWTIAGPWYWLENRVHQQQWKSYDNATEQVVNLRKTHLFLGLDSIGNRLDTGEQISEALDWAITNGAPIQYDNTGFPAVNAPLAEVRDVTSAEVIRMMLRWTPDAATWWDYTTTPPTFHCQRRAALDAVAWDMTAAPVESMRAQARRDLQRPAVVLLYEQVNSINGQNLQGLSVDKYPAEATGNEHRALVLTISLEGFAATYTYAPVVTAAINSGSAAWWSARLPWLAEEDVTSFTVAQVVRQGSLPRELTSGTLAAWMRDSEGDAIQIQRETISAVVSYTKADGTTGERPVSVTITATDATTGTYSNLDFFQSGEPVPLGVAQAVYDAVNALQYEGSLVLSEEDVSGTARPGKVLNVTGGRAEWATMAALIWQVVEDVETGITRVEFGPAPHLGATDLVELLRVNRSRFIFTSSRAMTAAEAGGLSGVEMPKEASREGHVPGADKYSRVVLSPLIAGGAVDIDTTKAQVNGQPKPLEIRPVSICITDPVTGATEDKTILVLASEPY